jgi:hypothetical protein
LILVVISILVENVRHKYVNTSTLVNYVCIYI